MQRLKSWRIDMTREEAKVLLPIIQAYAEGKAIESRCIKGDTSLWYDDKNPSFDDDFEYRVKPESKFRPFKNVDECWLEMLKHQPFGWVIKRTNKRLYNIQSVLDRNVLYIRSSYVELGKAFDDYVFADGTPFGVTIDEEKLWRL